MSRARALTGLLILFVLLDLLYSATQHYHQAIDGDLARIILPDAAHTPVLHDPFGLTALLNQRVYIGPNRFFAHASLLAYMRTVPGWLQAFVSPISSIYLAGTLFKTAVQATLLGLLATYATQASGSTQRWGRPFWFAAALMSPLFQTAGYQGQMGIIDRSITYTFFYAFPLTLLLALLWPFFQSWSNSQPLRLGWFRLALLLALVVYLSLHGPIIAGVVGVLLTGGLLVWLKLLAPASRLSFGLAVLTKRVPQPVWLVGGLMGLLAAYSLYLGHYDLENTGTQAVSLGQRYLLVPRGIIAELTSKLGLPLLVLAVLGNAWLITRRIAPSETSNRLLRVLRGLAWFAGIYLFLLPLGGYRPYRELILRYDTIMPITLGLLGCYASTTVYVLHWLPKPSLRWYQAGLVIFSSIYLFADKPLKPEASNITERAALEVLAAAPEHLVRLPVQGTVLSWDTMDDYRLSETNAQLLYHWGVTKEVKLYYQQ